jgi:urea transport system ATP-binding protein
LGLATRPRRAKLPERVFELFPALAQMLRRRGGDLSGGQRGRLHRSLL